MISGTSHLRHSPDDLLLVGRVARAHGNKGQVIVNPETDFPNDRFVAGQELIVEHRGAVVLKTIESVRFQQGRPIIGLHGIGTMNDAEALAGAELKVPAAALPPLPPRTFYRHDLVGCEVRRPDGARIGEVIGVEGPLERSRLVVQTGSREALIPMVDGICVSVDAAAKIIVVDPPDGLLDL